MLFFCSKVSVICQGQTSRSEFSKKWPVGGISVSQTHLVKLYDFNLNGLKDFIHLMLKLRIQNPSLGECAKKLCGYVY